MTETLRTDLVGDGYDPEPLLTATDVARWLRVPPKRVYELDIPRIRLGRRSVRWSPDDVAEFLQRRKER